ncbi:unnamed protein product [Arctogadus glacialis]
MARAVWKTERSQLADEDEEFREPRWNQQSPSRKLRKLTLKVTEPEAKEANPQGRSGVKSHGVDVAGVLIAEAGIFPKEDEEGEEEEEDEEEEEVVEEEVEGREREIFLNGW